MWYRRFTLFVAPSRQEGFGLTPLEAMASQTAVVTSDAGSFPSMIRPGVNGAIVPAGDADALAAAIEPYFREPDLAKERRPGGAGIRARQFLACGRGAPYPQRL